MAKGLDAGLRQIRHGSLEGVTAPIETPGDPEQDDFGCRVQRAKQRALTAKAGILRELGKRGVKGRECGAIVRGGSGGAGRSTGLEKPRSDEPASHYVLATLPKSITRKQVVRRIKQRWRIERSYEDLKGELGLDHFEGRSYRGWQHHVTCALACYAFLVAERARAFPPSARGAKKDHPIACAA